MGGEMILLCRDVDCVWPQRAEEIFQCQVGAVHERLPRWEKVTPSGSIVLLIHQSATHQCGTNQSCACVVIVIITFEPLSQGQRYQDTYVALCTICTAAKFQDDHIKMLRQPTTVRNNLIGISIKVMKIGRKIHYLWKLIWKLAACWGLENVAIAFLCWGIILNVCNTQK